MDLKIVGTGWVVNDGDGAGLAAPPLLWPVVKYTKFVFYVFNSDLSISINCIKSYYIKITIDANGIVSASSGAVALSPGAQEYIDLMKQERLEFLVDQFGIA
jgi:hypothetical protein